MEKKTIFEIAVIGGGPAGIMAAGRAGELGKEVLVLERNPVLGKKLLLTGKGRCNLAQAEFDPKELVKKYGPQGGFLFYPLSVFGVRETIDFFEKRGLKTKIERGKRVFPQSGKAGDVLNVLLDYLKKGKVKVGTGSRVKRIVKRGGKIEKVVLENKKEISARKYIIASGGKSYPETGSEGDGYKWAKELGHTVSKLRPFLVPFAVKENWPKLAQGLSLKNVKLTVFQNKKKKEESFGEMIFTHFGVSGPIVLDLSRKVGRLLERGEVRLVLDLKPALSFEKLDKRIRVDFLKYNNKLLKNSLFDLLPRKMIPVIINLSGINPDKKTNEITRKERQEMVKLLKNMQMKVSSLLGFEGAIVTAGGISLKEIDSKTMRSKLIDNLFFAGEIIDLQGPSGGYNLQVCWSTGYLAGQCSARF